MDQGPLRPAPNASHDARPAWMGFLGGAVVLALAILIAVGIWHFFGGSASPLTAAELTEIEVLLDELGFRPARSTARSTSRAATPSAISR
jgi:hypothetical protein